MDQYLPWYLIYLLLPMVWCFSLEKKILKKVGEETSEVIIAAKNNSSEETVSEISDLLYHLTVLMVNQGIKIEDLAHELEKRRMKICNKKVEKKLDSIH